MKITQVVRRSKLRFTLTMVLAVAGLLIPATHLRADHRGRPLLRRRRHHQRRHR